MGNVGTIPALAAKKDEPMMIGYMEAVFDKIATVLNKKGSVMEVPWVMCPMFIGFLWDSTGPNFEFKYLAWIVRRDLQVRMGGTARHEYQGLAIWAW